MLAAKKKLDRYLLLKSNLDSLPSDSVIYAEKIPKMVNNHTMLKGTIPVGNLAKYKYDNHTYCVFCTEVKTDKKIAKAVRLYDDVIKGKAPVYELALEQKESTDNIKVLQINKINETITTYATKYQSNQAPITQKIKPTTHNSYHEKANDLIAKLTESRNANIPVYWQDNVQKPLDKLQLTEMQMYVGWSL